MNWTLDYEDYEDIKCTFHKICPTSSMTRENQLTPKNPHQFTIVAYLLEEDHGAFQEVLDILRIPEHRFRWFLNLHCTLIPLFTQPSKIDENNLDIASSYIKQFFSSNKISELKVEFSIIHPGKWDRHKYESNGTVIALGQKKHNERFLNAVSNLQKNLEEAFKTSFRRRYNTAWCTLGFYDENDFQVDSPIYETFNNPKLRKFNLTTIFKEISITGFRLKSLDDGVRHMIPL
jgi:hypothetical protein